MRRICVICAMAVCVCVCVCACLFVCGSVENVIHKQLVANTSLTLEKQYKKPSRNVLHWNSHCNLESTPTITIKLKIPGLRPYPLSQLTQLSHSNLESTPTITIKLKIQGLRPYPLSQLTQLSHSYLESTPTITIKLKIPGLRPYSLSQLTQLSHSNLESTPIITSPNTRATSIQDAYAQSNTQFPHFTSHKGAFLHCSSAVKFFQN